MIITRELLNYMVGDLCTKCNSQVYKITDPNSPLVQHMKPCGKRPDPDDPRQNTSTISYSSMSHPSGLCYFHLKELENFFHAHYPLKKRPREFGDGGLASFPTSIRAHRASKARLGARPGLRRGMLE